jgi:hypothetical protein
MMPSRGRYVWLEGRRTSLLVTNHPLNALLRVPVHEAGALELGADYSAHRRPATAPNVSIRLGEV